MSGINFPTHIDKKFDLCGAATGSKESKVLVHVKWNGGIYVLTL